VRLDVGAVRVDVERDFDGETLSRVLAVHDREASMACRRRRSHLG
jgi:hypothetical protein